MTQPQPQPNNHPSVTEEVIADLRKREEKGIETYGVSLQPDNGRDSLRDLQDELLDAVQYNQQTMMNRDLCLNEMELRKIDFPDKESEDKFNEAMDDCIKIFKRYMYGE